LATPLVTPISELAIRSYGYVIIVIIIGYDADIYHSCPPAGRLPPRRRITEELDVIATTRQVANNGIRHTPLPEIEYWRRSIGHVGLMPNVNTPLLRHNNRRQYVKHTLSGNIN